MPVIEEIKTPIRDRSLSRHSTSSNYNNASVQYTVSDIAYIKLLSHLFKYQSNTVTGILIGKNNNNILHITDIIPLFHTVSLHLTSYIEIALLSIDTYINSLDDKQQQILGVYIGNGIIDIDNDSTISHVTHIANKLYQNNKQCVILAVDHNRLTNAITHTADNNNNTNDTALDVYTYNANQQRWCYNNDIATIVSNTAIQSIQTSLNNDNYNNTGVPQYYRLYDFDDHLDNVSYDWTNKHYYSDR